MENYSRIDRVIVRYVRNSKFNMYIIPRYTCGYQERTHLSSPLVKVSSPSPNRLMTARTYLCPWVRWPVDTRGLRLLLLSWTLCAEFPLLPATQGSSRLRLWVTPRSTPITRLLYGHSSRVCVSRMCLCFTYVYVPVFADVSNKHTFSICRQIICI